MTLLEIKITHGELEFESFSLHEDGSDQALMAYLNGFYDGEPDWDGDVCYFRGGEIACEIENAKKITSEEADVLRRLGVAY